MKFLVLISLLSSVSAFAGKCPESQIDGLALSVAPKSYGCFLFASEDRSSGNYEFHRVILKCTQAEVRYQFTDVRLRFDEETGLCSPLSISRLRPVK